MGKTVSDAAALAAAPKRDYAKAIALVASVRTDLADELKSLYVDNPKVDIKKLKAKSASSLVTEDIKEIDELQAEIVSDLANGAWRKVMLSGRRLNELVGIAIRVADRRGAFDTQRAATRKAIDGLKKHAVFAAQAAEMEKLLTQADEAAGPKTMRIEDAVHEKLIAAEAGIDDHTIELAKVGVIRNLDQAPVGANSELRLLGVDDANLVLRWFQISSEDLKEVVTVPKTVLTEIDAKPEAWQSLRDDLTAGSFVDYRRLLIGVA